MAVKRKFKKASRTGAAAFAVSLYLAGPHAVAGADSAPDDTSSGAGVSSDALGTAQAKGKSSAGPRGVRPGRTAGSSVGADRPVGFAPQSTGQEPEGGSKQASRVSRGNSDSGPRPAGATQPSATPAAGELGEDPADTSAQIDSDGTEVAGGGDAVLMTAVAPTPKQVAAAKAAPKSAAAPSAALPPVLANVNAQMDAAVVRVFSGLMNWISTLPVNPVTNWLEGGLLLVRKNLFNQSASVNAFQNVNNSQQVTGKIDVVDPEGEGWTLEVVGNPSHGTVILGVTSQANGIGSTNYTFTPGPGYAGDDSFVVKVTPTERVFNITDPFGLMESRYYTVALGDAAASGNACASCLAKDALDATLFLGNAGATVTVEKQGVLIPRYAATVTLSEHAANQAFAWMDTRGRTGFVSVDQMVVEGWSAFEDKASQNAVKPLLAFSYTDQGVSKAVFIDVSGVTKNDDGTYEFTGQLMDDVTAQEGRVDAWDYLGIDYKTAYQNFIDSSGLANCQSGAVCTTVTTAGILAATTLSPSAYVSAGGHDYELLTPGDASAIQTSPGSIGPDVAAGNTGEVDTYLTATIPWGNNGSFITATNMGQSSTSNNGVYLYNANAPAGSQPTWAPAELIGNGWDAAVMAMTSWDQIVTDSNGDPIPATFTGNVSGNILNLALPNTFNPAVLVGQPITGSSIMADTVITGFVSASGGNVSYTVNTWDSEGTGTITVTAPNVPTLQPGLVVVLSDGAVEYWNGGGCSQTSQGCDSSITSQAYGQGWTQLQASNSAGWGADVSASTVIALPENKGIAVALSNGEVYLWNSPVLADGTIVPGEGVSGGCSGSSVGSCWTQLEGSADFDSAVTAMIASGTDGGVIVGLANGSVQKWTPGGQFEQIGSGLSSAVTTLLPYDGTTLLGAISGTPVIAEDGVISEPSWAPSLESLSAFATGCQSSYNAGSGTGCGGYILTVQSVAGNPITAGQQLYGGAGLAPGTTVIQQISDEDGNLCSNSCFEGGAGVYLVNSSQLVAPGTPMNASNGTGFVVGLENGSVQQWDTVLGEYVELQNDGWGSAVNTMISWRDGLVVGLNNGAVFYWSPSNSPDGLNDDNPNALDYPGSTVTSQSTQTAGWSQLQGTGWDSSITSMVPIGDGFALGLTAPNSSHNGAVMMFTGFEPTSSTSAFGYSMWGGEALNLTPSDSFTQIADQSALSGDESAGSVQQMIPVSGYITNASGNLVFAESVITGLTNNGIYVWTGTTQDNDVTTWSQLQAPGTGAKPTLTADQLQAAWAYGSAANSDTAWGAAGGVGATYVAASGSTPASGDPIFGLVTNQAWCNSKCSSYGDYSPLVFSNEFGDDGTIFSFGTDVETAIDLSSITYGYVFYPSSIIDKFIPGKYSVAMLAAFQGGPSVTLDMSSTSATVTESVTGPELSWYEPTEIGTFSLGVGLNASISAGVNLNSVPSGPVEVAEAIFTPGMLYTWNVSGYTKNMSVSSNYYSDINYITPEEAAEYLAEDSVFTVTPTVTPYTQATYGLFTPPSTPLIGEWAVFDLGVGYQNPISFTLAAPADDISDLSMTVTSQGFITANAGFLPNVTSLLSWNNQFQVYSWSDEVISG